jgi:hypothetical protein
VKVFSYNELRKATLDFSGANKIGEGGFGSVFRVNMHELLPTSSVSKSLDIIKHLSLTFHFASSGNAQRRQISCSEGALSDFKARCPRVLN